MPLPDESGRLARRHLDGQIGFLYRDAADTVDHVAGVEQEPELPGWVLGDLVQALRCHRESGRSRTEIAWYGLPVSSRAQEVSQEAVG